MAAIAPPTNFTLRLLEFLRGGKKDNSDVSAEIERSVRGAQATRARADTEAKAWDETEKHIRHSLYWEDLIPDPPAKAHQERRR